MKNTVILAAVAGLTSAAAAQTASFTIVPSSTTIDTTVTTSFTLAVYVSADFGTHIAGGEFALTSNGGSDIVNMTGAAASWGALGENDRGHDGNGNHNGLVFGQLIFPPFIMPSVDSALTGQVLAGVISVEIAANTWFGMGGLNWAIVVGQGAFMVEVFDSADDSFTQITNATGGTSSMTVTPAPSSMAMLGLGGLVATRRRR